jgi:hypothetical protein
MRYSYAASGRIQGFRAINCMLGRFGTIFPLAVFTTLVAPRPSKYIASPLICNDPRLARIMNFSDIAAMSLIPN